MRPFSIALTPFVVCFLLAAGMWVYASMREEYAMTIDLPFEVRLPQNRAMETPLPAVVQARVQGAGWLLMNMNFTNQARCVVYVPEKLLLRTSDEEQFGSVQVTKDMLRQGLQLPAGVHALEMLSEPLVAQVGVIDQKNVPLRPVLQVQPRDGFIITGISAITPDSITLRSNKRTLAALHHWNTVPIVLRDVYEPQTVQTALSDSLAGVVQVLQRGGTNLTPSVGINVQQMAELTLDDVPVALLSAPPSHNLVLSPVRLRVTVRGGVGQIAKLTASDVTAFVEYSEAQSNYTGVLVPHISTPPEVTIIHTEPPRVQCVRRLPPVTGLAINVAAPRGTK
jgi:hypothetical protein